MAGGSNMAQEIYKDGISAAEAMEKPQEPQYNTSDLTNIKVLKSRKFHDYDKNEDRVQSLVEYIPYGDKDNPNARKLWGVIDNYNNEPIWTKGAIVAVSPELAEEDYNSQYELGTQGHEKYLGRGPYNADFFDLLKRGTEPEDEGLRKKYAEKYGWDYTKEWPQVLEALDLKYGHKK